METKHIYDKPYISVIDIQDLGLAERIATILDEGREQENYGKKRLVIKIQLAKTLVIKDFKLTGETWKKLSESWGTDSKEWLGKQIRLMIREYKDGLRGVIAEPINLNKGDTKN